MCLTSKYRWLPQSGTCRRWLAKSWRAGKLCWVSARGLSESSTPSVGPHPQEGEADKPYHTCAVLKMQWYLQSSCYPSHSLMPSKIHLCCTYDFMTRCQLAVELKREGRSLRYSFRLVMSKAGKTPQTSNSWLCAGEPSSKTSTLFISVNL